MRRVVICLLLLSLGLALELKIKSSLEIDDSYQLSCDDAHGQVHYEVHNLPRGVELKGDRIRIYDEPNLKEGPVTLRISARDERGYTDERIVVIIFKKKVHQTHSKNTQQHSNPTPQPNPDEAVNQVLDELFIPTNIQTNYQYPENGYPKTNFPQGANSDIPNFAPDRISKQQATPSSSNRNTITSDDVKANAIFQRQLNAAKALANLLSIVKQATANRNYAQQEIAKRSKLHDEAKAAQRAAEEGVVRAENDLARINKGIEATNERINQIRAEIDSLVSLKDKKKAERDSIRDGLSNAKGNLKETNNQIAKQKQNLANAELDLSDKDAGCEALDDEISSVSDQLSDRKLKKASLMIQIRGAVSKVSDDAVVVDDLRNRLREAEASLLASRNALTALNQQADDLDQTIANTEKRLADLRDRLEECSAEFKVIQARVNELKNEILPALEIKRLEIENQIKRLSGIEDSLTEELKKIPMDIALLEEQQPKFLEKLRVLRSQIFIYESRLRAAYQVGNAANQKLAQAKENLDAANKKYVHEDKIIQESTHNIELARVQKEKADRAVEDYLREGADILPFAAAPGETGFESLGGGKYAIKSWEQYVEVAFGQGVKPLFIGDLKSLYSFKVDPEEEGDCAAENQRSISGYIIEVKEKHISVINDEGKLFDVSFDECTKALSNVEDYKFANGDIVVLKGIQEGNIIKATQLTSIRR